MFRFLRMPEEKGVRKRGLKYPLPGTRGEGWYLISGLGHKINCQTRNTIESFFESESLKNSYMTFSHL